MQIFATFVKNIKIKLVKKTKLIIDLKLMISSEYHDFLNVFSKKLVDVLSSHRKHDHTIKLKLEIEELSYAFLYNMSEDELLLIKKYLEENLKQRFLTISSVSFVFSILFAKKSEKELRLCVDYRKLNVIIRKN